MIRMDFGVDWKTAWKCCKKIVKNPGDTKNIFALSRAVNGPTLVKTYHKLLETKEGGEIACNLPELTDIYPQLDKCPVGSVGHEFLTNQKYPLETLIRASKRGTSNSINLRHPYLWMARRQRDTHDIHHVLTGYQMDVLGEGCVAAFTYAQTKSYHWGLIFLVGIWMFKSSPMKVAALFEAYRRGKKCSWLLGEDFEKMMFEDLEKCRTRLNLPKAKIYDKVIENR